MKLAFKIILIAGLLLYAVLIGSWWQEGEYERRTAEHCQQYRTIPETQVDRIPDGCLPYYYEGR